MKTIIVLCMSVLAILPAPARAAEPDIARDVARLEQAYESLSDMQAVFSQQSSSGAVPVVQRASGRVYFKKKGKMLWQYETPEEQHIILDGTTLWVYLPDEKQAMKNNFATIPQHIVVDLFRGKMEILKKFKAAYALRAPDDTADQVVLELEPLEPDPMIASLVVRLDPRSYLVEQSSLTDALGNRTVLTFQDIRVDQGLSDSLFEFTPPRGVDVFEPPQL